MKEEDEDKELEKLEEEGHLHGEEFNYAIFDKKRSDLWIQ